METGEGTTTSKMGHLSGQEQEELAGGLLLSVFEAVLAEHAFPSNQLCFKCNENVVAVICYDCW